MAASMQEINQRLVELPPAALTARLFLLLGLSNLLETHGSQEALRMLKMHPRRYLHIHDLAMNIPASGLRSDLHARYRELNCLSITANDLWSINHHILDLPNYDGDATVLPDFGIVASSEHAEDGAAPLEFSWLWTTSTTSAAPFPTLAPGGVADVPCDLGVID
eukprot:m.9325 g.9325  ORF g.9325 m.9325 type:complete len:164 (-) comp2388_c0_seq1:177-668(-)